MPSLSVPDSHPSPLDDGERVHEARGIPSKRFSGHCSLLVLGQPGQPEKNDSTCSRPLAEHQLAEILVASQQHGLRRLCMLQYLRVGGAARNLGNVGDLIARFPK
jgi:hypothetical protein